MKKILFSFSIIFLATISIHAQFEDEGKLNAWTTEKVQHNRETEDVSYSVCKVRVAKNKGFEELDPLSLAISTDLGAAYYYARQYDRTIEHLKKLTELDPNYVRTHFYLAWVYQEKGMFEEAIAELEKGNILEGKNIEEVAREKTQITNALKTSGAKGYWQKLLDLTKEDAQRKGEPVNPADIATFYAHLNKRDEAFEWLEKAYQERSVDLPFLKVSPEWDNLRTDPRFTDLMRRLGLPQ